MSSQSVKVDIPLLPNLSDYPEVNKALKAVLLSEGLFYVIEDEFAINALAPNATKAEKELHDRMVAHSHKVFGFLM